MPFSLDPPPGDNELECARCGAYFYHGLTRCPECGVNLYEPDEESDDEYYQNTIDAPTTQGSLSGRIRNIFRRITGKPYSAEEVFGDALDQAILYNDLLSKVGGDQAAVDRLIEFEQGQNPGGTRAAWLKDAILRWDRDNRVEGPSS